MKTVKIIEHLRVAETKDIINSFEKLRYKEIERFVCEYENLKDIKEFLTKTVKTKSFGTIVQHQKVWHDKRVTEYYSGRTAAVYTVVFYDDMMFFEDIQLKGHRHDDENIGYGFSPYSGQACRFCKKCNTIISSISTQSYCTEPQETIINA